MLNTEVGNGALAGRVVATATDRRTGRDTDDGMVVMVELGRPMQGAAYIVGRVQHEGAPITDTRYAADAAQAWAELANLGGQVRHGELQVATRYQPSPPPAPRAERAPRH